MIQLHYWPTPNGHKISMFLEEAGLPYQVVPVNIGKGDQFKPDFLKLSPNNRYLEFQDARNPLPASPNQRGKGKWKRFDLQELRLLDEMQNDTFPPAPAAETDKWGVHTTHPGYQNEETDNGTERRKSAVRWWITHPSLASPQLLPWSAVDGLPRCFVLLKAVPGKTPTRLVVGHDWGGAGVAGAADRPTDHPALARRRGVRRRPGRRVRPLHRPGPARPTGRRGDPAEHVVAPGDVTIERA